MSKKKKIFKGGEKSKTKKCISTEKIGGGLGFSFVFSLSWRISRSSHLPV